MYCLKDKQFDLPDNCTLPPDVAAGCILRMDSRLVQPGDVFVACQGEYADGRNYIPAAIANGAAMVFWDSGDGFAWRPEWQIANLGVPHLKQNAGLLAAKLYGNLSGSLSCWGVTGTNGKTSISQWLAQAADLLGTPFSSAIFTNLTRDHLDYHGSMAAYGASKAKLFYWQSLQHAIINTDDEFGRELAAGLRADRPSLNVYGYGFNEQADIRITHFAASAQGMQVAFNTPWGSGEIHSRLLGRFNAQNLAACVGLLCAEGYALPDVLRVLAQIRPATGRMDCISRAGRPLVVVDYAHTPDALEKALATLREIKPQGASLWCVFGCGGNRDRGKRPLMGSAAAQGADKVVITSDNPRMEEPQDIIADILPAVPQPELVEADRRVAIQTAIRRAAPQDIVLIAGKGHETYQDVQGEKHHFSDFEIAEAALDEAT